MDNPFQKGKRILVIPDTQAKPGVDLSYMSWIGEYIVDKRPDVVVHLGDAYDFPSLSSYDKGKLSFEGRRLREDIEVGHRSLELLLEPLKSLQQKQKFFKKKVYTPRMVFCLGNHCIEENTEVLTEAGWKTAKEITTEDTLLTVDLGNGVVEHSKPEIITKEPNKIAYRVLGDDIDELVSSDHSVVFKGKRTVVSELEGKHPKTDFMLSCQNNYVGIDTPKNWIRLLTWVITDGCLVQGETKNKVRVQFKLSKERKISRLRNLLDTMGIDYTFKECKKTGVNKLQPYYIRIYGDNARKVFSFLQGKKTFPAAWVNVNKEQADAIIEELGHTDGYLKDNRLDMITTDITSANILQNIGFKNGYPCRISIHANNSGFKNGKTQYRLKFTIGDNLLNRRKVSVFKTGEVINTIAITVKNSTIITRRDGKMSVTGNCERLARVAQTASEFEGFIGYELLGLEELGWEVHDFLKPVEIQGINFVHFLANPFTGKPYGGSAMNQLKQVGCSYVVGHKQTLDVAIRPTLDGKMQLGIVCGACYPFPESYKGHQGNNHFRGLILLNDAHDGYADPCFVSLSFLERKFG